MMQHVSEIMHVQNPVSSSKDINRAQVWLNNRNCAVLFAMSYL